VNSVNCRELPVNSVNWSVGVRELHAGFSASGTISEVFP
jgi:hypothetical protein